MKRPGNRLLREKISLERPIIVKIIPNPGILCSEQSLDTALLILPAVANLLAHEIRAVQYNLKEGVDQLASGGLSLSAWSDCCKSN